VDGSEKQQHVDKTQMFFSSIKKRNNHIKNITAITIMVVMFFFISCGGNQEFEQIKESRDQQALLTSDTVTTLISDSGITKYKVAAIRWEIYDKTEEPIWKFPNGLEFDKFNENYETDAHMQADSAIYYEQKKLWEFRKNVHAQNKKNEHFTTDLLFYDDNKKEFYSDTEITIKREDKIIYGIGFTSNADMTRYTIQKPTGIIPVEKTE
jgi:LPS export ABC transporter protein LptC